MPEPSRIARGSNSNDAPVRSELPASNNETTSSIPFAEAMSRLGAHAGNGSLGFIAVAATPWHALGVDAWIEHLRASGDNRPGAVLLMRHPGNGQLITPSSLPLALRDGKVEFLTVSGRLPTRLAPTIALTAKFGLRALSLAWRNLRHGNTKSSEPAPLRIACPRLPDLFTLLSLWGDQGVRRRPFEFAILDEGLSSYLPSSVASQVRRRDRRRGKQGVVLREVELFIRNGYEWAHRLFASPHQIVSRLLFEVDATTGTLALRRDVASDYRTALSLHEASRIARPIDCAIALFVSQPWAEYGELDAETNVAKAVVGQLRTLGYEVWIKPHPRDTPDKFAFAQSLGGVRLLTQGIPIETTFAQLEACDVVIGYNSTSQLTARALSPAMAYTLGVDFGIAKPGATFQAFQSHFEQLAGPLVASFDKIPPAARVARRTAC